MDFNPLDHFIPYPKEVAEGLCHFLREAFRVDNVHLSVDKNDRQVLRYKFRGIDYHILCGHFGEYGTAIKDMAWEVIGHPVLQGIVEVLCDEDDNK